MSGVKDTRGVYQKYVVRRTDGRDEPGEMHQNCWLFVLDLDHDAYALPALRAYADACQFSHPELANDLRAMVERKVTGKPLPPIPFVEPSEPCCFDGDNKR